MATHAGNSIEYIAHIAEGTHESFRDIWHLDSLKIAKNDNGYWLKGFSLEDLNRAEVRSILNVQLFEMRNQLLYVKGNRVPERKMPTGLLWHPIQQALKVELPSFNENLFEVPGKLTIEFEISSEARETYASIVKSVDVKHYVDTVPEHYFSDLKWCVFGKDQVVLVGETIPPIVSKRYWKYKRLLLPVGYDFKFQFLKEIVTELQQKSDSTNFWVFNDAGYYFSLSEDQLAPMSRSSVKFTLQQ